MRTLSDLRSYLRLDSSFDVLFKVMPEKKGDRRHRAQALDMGAGGIKVFADRHLKKGTQLELYFYVDQKRQESSAASALGEVIWCREIKVDHQGLGRYEVGIRFAEIDPKDRDRIFQYIYKKLATQKRVRQLIRRVQY